MFSFFTLSGADTEDTTEYIADEELEEYRMVSGLDQDEILRLYGIFRFKVGTGDTVMFKDTFLSLDCMVNNPLKEQVCRVFGFGESDTIDFKTFLCGVAEFNSPSPALREQKLKVAFKLQDMDGDGVISKSDMITYLKATTYGGLQEVEIQEIVQNVFRECCSDSKQEVITFNDFQRVIAPTDFHIKLNLPI